MPTKRQIQLGDRYYYQIYKELFTVVSQGPVGDPHSWILSSGDEGHTLFRHQIAWAKARYAMSTGPDFKVTIGSTWYTYGCGELCTVVQSNDSREAGIDSWRMKGIDSHKILYMHHDLRVEGKWLHVEPEYGMDPTPVVRRSRYQRTPVI